MCLEEKSWRYRTYENIFYFSLKWLFTQIYLDLSDFKSLLSSGEESQSKLWNNIWIWIFGSANPLILSTEQQFEFTELITFWCYCFIKYHYALGLGSFLAVTCELIRQISIFISVVSWWISVWSSGVHFRSSNTFNLTCHC